MAQDEEFQDLAEELASEEVAFTPGDTADPRAVVEAKIPADIRERFEVYSYRNAAVILSEGHREEFAELMSALRDFTITTTMIRTAGGNESDIPKLLSSSLRPNGWYETVIQGDLVVTLIWREQVTTARGKLKFERRERQLTRAKFLDGHKIDYVKGKVAFDLEWNSKDQTFDRDLYAFNAFAQCGVIDVAVLLTRSKSLDGVFRQLGPALTKSGKVELKRDQTERQTMEKYGASTTWMGKLLYRLNAGRNGGCPVLAVGITPKCISDWNE
jgi:hypothetical protein